LFTTAIDQFTELNVDELPVVASDNKNKVVGVLRRKETIALYNKRRLELQKQKDVEQS
jgi:chloride channel protein, CIC family